MDDKKFQIGMIGLGVMGRNLLLNMADHGFSVAGYDKDLAKVQTLRQEAQDRDVLAAGSLQELVARLEKPRAVMMLVPAGSPVDAVIRDVLPYLEPGDLIIDGGNSYYKDTQLRQQSLADRQIRFLGVGISGGESGARHGPSMMPGGPLDAYERVRPIFEAAAAKVNGEPCVTYLGPGPSGHYVKMAHNGIEYGLMELIAESYDLMKRGLGMSDQELRQVYAAWNQKKLNSYLIEITANIFEEIDPETGKPLIDVILDEAKQKGTGKWTSQDAMDLQVPVPTIDAAVAMRNLSAFKVEREAASGLLEGPTPAIQGDRNVFIKRLGNALYAGLILTFAQGMAQLKAASEAYEYGLKLEDVARIWRGGCIIRAALLEDIRSAYHARPDLPNLLLDRKLGGEVWEFQSDLRAVVKAGVDAGLPVPALMVSLGYYDGYRSANLPANLTQAQRDYFGSHTYERVDEKGAFHTEWQQEQ